MRYKQFKNSGVKVSSLAVGTWAIGGDGYGEVNEKDSIEAIRTMVDNGVNIIDTASSYGAGHSEEVVGKALRDGYRDKVLISTKFGIPFFKDYANDGTYDNCIKECEGSLKRLGTDHIDFFFMHWPDPNTPVEETMRALNDLKKQGKIRFIGVSNFSQELLEEAMQYATIDAIQPPYSMVNQSAKPLMQWCEGKGIDTFTYGSLGAGILTGAIRELPHYDKDDARYEFYDFFVEPKFSRVMELLKSLDVIAEAHNNCPIAQIAINWSTQKSYVGTALCGVRNSREALENCKTFDWQLTDEEIETIDKVLDEMKIG